MYNPVIRAAASIILLAAFAVVLFSSLQTAKILKEKIRKMIRTDADLKKAFKILKNAVSGKGEKGDGTELLKAVFGLSGDLKMLSDRVFNPGLSL